MKKQVLLFSILLLTAGAMAQPTLTAVTNNPVAGDVFTGIPCDTAGITQGVYGTGITWDYHTLVATSAAQINFTTCTSTPYCDSFSGSNLAIAYIDQGIDSEYEYYTANTNVFAINGEYMGRDTFLYTLKPIILLRYPLTYNSIFLDTSILYIAQASPVYSINENSTKVDAYGTLILPSGTYNNVLREHNIQTIYDSIPGIGAIYAVTTESYIWFTPNFHFELLEIDLDSSAGTYLSVSNVTYYTNTATGIVQINNNGASIVLSPDPASDILNIQLNPDEMQKTSITISDISGRVVGNINAGAINNGNDKLQYSVADMPSGIYIVHLVNDTHNISKKLVVSH